MTESSSIQTAMRGPVPVRQILGTVGAELQSLAEVGERLQHLAGRLLSSACMTLDDRTIQEAQELDALVQRLRGLSTFLAELLPGISPQWRLDARSAAHGVSLAELAGPLAHRDENEPPASVPTPGEFELF